MSLFADHAQRMTQVHVDFGAKFLECGCWVNAEEGKPLLHVAGVSALIGEKRGTGRFACIQPCSLSFCHSLRNPVTSGSRQQLSLMAAQLASCRDLVRQPMFIFSSCP